ncbi:MAG: hypothetical protein COB37_10920 [Kordiimonadales bacterium]|nr:MAG: hypothetical protein COB37_10920 [Kordiimonadales bacterium]
MRHIIIFAVVTTLLAACAPDAITNSGQQAAQSQSEKSELQQRREARIKQMADNWPGTVNLKDPFNALDPMIKPSSVGRGSVFDANDDYWGLPRTPGYEEVATYCASCHSLAIVMQQHVTPERWQYLLTWMLEKQNMPPLDPEEHALVLKYLTTNFSSGSK